MLKVQTGCKVRKNTLAYPEGALGDVIISEPKMAVTAAWSVEVQDTDGDVVEIAGIDLSLHQRNPIILGTHSQGQPVAKAEDPAGLYTARKEDRRLIGTAYFTEKNRLSEETFLLYAERILRAWSIGFLQVEVAPVGEAFVTGAKGVRVKKSILLECSCVAVGANQEALTISVQKGRITDPLLLQSLRPYLLRRKMFDTGNLKLAPVNPKAAVVLQSVLAEPSEHFPGEDAFKSWLAGKGYKADAVCLTPAGDKLVFAAVQAEPERCLSEGTYAVELDKEKGVVGLFARLDPAYKPPAQKAGKEGGDDFGADEEEEKSFRLKGRAVNKIKGAARKLAKMADEEDEEEKKKALKAIAADLGAALKEMDEEDEGQKRRKEDDDEMTDEEAEKAIAEYEREIAEMEAMEKELTVAGI